MTEKELEKIKSAIADQQGFQRAGLGTLLRYDRAINKRDEIPPMLRDELHRRITRKIIVWAAMIVIIASVIAAMISLLDRVFVGI